MKIFFSLGVFLLITVGGLGGCKKKGAFTAAEQTAAANLKEVKDPVLEEIFAFRQAVRQNFNKRRFAELEKHAAELRRSKAVFDNGSWKLYEFYESLTCEDNEPESLWQLHEQIHRDWITAFPQSVTARVAYADFFVSYAWEARGAKYAGEVAAERWPLFRERLASAQRTLEEARALPEKDAVCWAVTLRVARGQGWEKSDYDRAVREANAFEPHYWKYDTYRAETLLPRWYGEPGDWEAYTEEAAARPDGLGDEVYARMVIALHIYYKNVFRETKVSWPKTRAGLERLRQQYPRSLDFMSETAFFAVLSGDRALAKELFAQLGDRYLARVWRDREYFVRCRNWAAEGG